MPLQDVSPYEVLGLDVTASSKDIVKSVPEALKRGRFPKAQIIQASNDLRSARKRLEYDLLELHCPASDLDEILARLREILGSLPPPAFVPTRVEPLPMPPFLTGLGQPEAEHDLHPLPEPALDFEDPGWPDTTPAPLPPVPFPARH